MASEPQDSDEGQIDFDALFAAGSDGEGDRSPPSEPSPVPADAQEGTESPGEERGGHPHRGERGATSPAGAGSEQAARPRSGLLWTLVVTGGIAASLFALVYFTQPKPARRPDHAGAATEPTTEAPPATAAGNKRQKAEPDGVATERTIAAGQTRDTPDTTSDPGQDAAAVPSTERDAPHSRDHRVMAHARPAKPATDLRPGAGASAPAGAAHDTSDRRDRARAAGAHPGPQVPIDNARSTDLAMADDGPASEGNVAETTLGQGKELPPLPPNTDIDIGRGTTMEFVLVRPGWFPMGDAFGESNERPEHVVMITKSFYIGKYEVTQKQWEEVMGSNPSHHRGAKRPVERVSWADCQTMLRELNKRASGMRFRLPTEAEWEFACRAGTTTDYCFGDSPSQLGQFACFRDGETRSTREIGKGKPNGWGLHDMYGNVWEWCEDKYGAYRGTPKVQADPVGASATVEGRLRVLRGGSCQSPPADCRSASRHACDEDQKYSHVGFRVVVTLPSSPSSSTRGEKPSSQ